jgi:hypothetical protein
MAHLERVSVPGPQASPSARLKPPEHRTRSRAVDAAQALPKGRQFSEGGAECGVTGMPGRGRAIGTGRRQVDDWLGHMTV